VKAIYQTPKLLGLSSDTELEHKEKELLFVKQPSINLGASPVRSRIRRRIESFMG
jgi:hypothetical protein